MSENNDTKMFEEILKLIKTTANMEKSATNNSDTALMSAINENSKIAAEGIGTAEALITLAKGASSTSVTTSLLTTGFIMLASYLDAESELLKQLNQLDETSQAIRDYTTDYNKKFSEKKEEKFNTADLKSVRLNYLWDNIQRYVDKNSSIDPSSEDELNRDISTFNKIVQDEKITISNGKIEGYSSLQDSMDEYIKDVILKDKKDGLYDSYVEAEIYVDHMKELCTLAYAEMLDADAEFDKIDKRQKEADENGYKDGWEWADIHGTYYYADERRQQARDNYSALSGLLNSYYSVIDEYESLSIDGTEYDAAANADKINAEFDEIRTKAREIFSEKTRTRQEQQKSVSQLNAEDTKKRIEEENQRLAEERKQEQSKSVAQLNAEESAKLAFESYIRDEEKKRKLEQSKSVAQLNAEDQARIFQKSLIDNAEKQDTDSFSDFAELAEFFESTPVPIISNIIAEFQAEMANSVPAAVYETPIYNTSSENPSCCSCKMDVDRILEGLNKPINIYLDREKVGSAVMQYQKEQSRMQGI